MFTEEVKGAADGLFVEIHHWIAVGLLVGGVLKRV